MSIRVLIADDQAMVRAGLRLILESRPDMEVVAEAADGEAAVAAARRLSPDVVLMDVRMPRLDGIEATRLIISELRSTRVLILTTFDVDEYVFKALQAGASGFLLKESSPEQLISAIQLVAGGDALVMPSRTRRLIEAHYRPSGVARPAAIKTLTTREAEVLIEVAGGLDNSAIGKKLHVSEATVRTHVTHILSKLEARSRVQAVVMAYESGLVVPALRAKDI
ncbi:MAG TPA: response regulator transcription factor [Candidatus Dormibacteraeota bacterium]